jgi:hypothetical protein
MIPGVETRPSESFLYHRKILHQLLASLSTRALSASSPQGADSQFWLFTGAERLEPWQGSRATRLSS